MYVITYRYLHLLLYQKVLVTGSFQCILMTTNKLKTPE